MYILELKFDNPITSYKLLKVLAKNSSFSGKTARPLVFPILLKFDLSQNSNLNTPLERPSQELLNAYFSFEI